MAGKDITAGVQKVCLSLMSQVPALVCIMAQPTNKRVPLFTFILLIPDIQTVISIFILKSRHLLKFISELHK